MPRRIQLRRKLGWRKPAGAVVVTRPSVFGNPYRGPGAVDAYRKLLADAAKGAPSTVCGEGFEGGYAHCDICSPASLATFAGLVLARMPQLRGKDLCCWCPLGKPCHADVLIELANR